MPNDENKKTDFTEAQEVAGGDCVHRLVRPGERLLIAVTFPEELDESESCHPDIVLEDFLASRNDGSWQVEVYSILPNSQAQSSGELTDETCSESTHG